MKYLPANPQCTGAFKIFICIERKETRSPTYLKVIATIDINAQHRTPITIHSDHKHLPLFEMT